MSAKKAMKRVKVNTHVDRTAEDVDDEKDLGENTFYVAGIGGSAGGLEAFEQFFRSMPEDTGIALVVISHLDPTRKGSMPELLQRYTNMPVTEATEGVKVEPNHVYVIPSNKDITISHGELNLSEPLSPRGPRMPIDLFFRSLAIDQGKMGIGIIFSGMGTDGTLGIKAIKEKLGMVMAEEPTTARFDSMPKSAINTGVVDYIASPADMPKYLLEYTKVSHDFIKEGPGTLKNYTLIDRIFTLIENRTGHDFSSYKMTTISRRIERRMSVLQLKDTLEYARYMENNHDEVEALFKELLIGVTSFFRDSEAFQVLEKTAISEMLKNKPDGSVIRIWVPGCSTGEEAYSIAILMAESLGHRKDKVQIFATDIDREAIEAARKGDYPDNIIADVSRERLQKFFIAEDGHYKVKKDIRDMVVFAEQDVIEDPPFTNLDLVSCRNLLIYLKSEVQNKVLLLFLYALNPGGILFLGPSESVGHLNNAFAALDNKWKVYRRREYLSKKELAATIPVATSPPIERASAQVMKVEPAITQTAQALLLEYFSPPAVLINAGGDIIYVNGHTGKYLEPSPGKAVMNVHFMARKGLAADLSIAVNRAEKEKKEVVVKGLEVQTNGDKQAINLIIKPVAYPEALKNYLLVVFQDVEAKKLKVGGKGAITLDRCKEVTEELIYTKQRLQSTQEEMSASQEELRSVNEEIQSTNEELQSTNEELTTSKEELQSLNEELITVNSELQAKIDDLSRASNDMNNLLNSTEIATIFLDNHLKIMRYTPASTRVVNLIPGDIGRPFTDIAANITYEHVAADAKKVADNLAPVEREIRMKDGCWYYMRIIPYRTVENVIDGVVLTFNEITKLKCLEESLTSARNYSENIIATIREPIIVLGNDMKVISANRSFFRDFKADADNTIGHDLFELGNGQWDIAELKKALKEILPRKKEMNDFKVEHDFPNIGHKVMMLNAREIKSEDNNGLILLAIEDISGKQHS